MSELLKKQFQIGRDGLFKDIEGIAPELFDVQNEGLPNTIHWQLGHILVAADNFLFGGKGNLPADYNDLFGYGSRPSNWTSNVPSVEILVSQLKEQLNHIQEIPVDSFANQLPEPILGNATFGELVSFTSFHELTHIGQIHVMVKIAKVSRG